MRTAILGGGFTGILAARLLAGRGHEVSVFESQDRIGGLCRSVTIDGAVCDVAGGHILHSRDPEVLASMLAVLGGATATERRTKIFHRGRYVKYPFENGLGELDAQENAECLGGYIEAHVARRLGAEEPADFRSWIPWRFGEGIARNFMLPYNEKIWCSDLRDVSSAWCSGRVPEAPLEDVIRGALGLPSEGYTHQLRFHYPLRGGFQTLVEAFARGIEDRIRTSTPVRELGRDSADFLVNGERFERVVNTLPLPVLFDVLGGDVPADVRAAVGGLRHLSLATVFLVVDSPELSPLSWVYFPHSADGPMNRITHLSNYGPHNAPPGHSTLMAEITAPGGSRPPSPEALTSEVVDHLAGNGLLPRQHLVATRCFFNEYAYPLHDTGMNTRLERVLGWLAEQGVASLGRFGRYAYANTDQLYRQVHDWFAAGQGW